MIKVLLAALFLTPGALIILAQTSSQGMGTIQTPDGSLLKVPSNVYVKFETIAPQWTSTDLGGYQACAYNQQTGFQFLPCASSYALQNKRMVALPFCSSGQRVESPVQCFCTAGMAGNSGKCK